MSVGSAWQKGASSHKAARTLGVTSGVFETVDSMETGMLELMAAVRLAVREEMQRIGGSQLPTVLDYKQAARELSVSPSTLKSMVKSGAIQRCDRGLGGVGIPKDEILRFAALRREAPAGRKRTRRSMVGSPATAFSGAAEVEKAKRLRKKR